MRAAIVLLVLVGAPPDEEPWRHVTTTDGIRVENRTRPGTSVKEVRATGVLDASPDDLKAVVDDVGSFAEFVPFTAESRVLERGEGFAIVYQKVDAPFLSVRDYVARVSDRSTTGPDGKRVLMSVWAPAPGKGPRPHEDVVRIEVIDGYWRFTDAGDGRRAHVEYRLFTDPGGAIPAFVINSANEVAFPRILRAVEARAHARAKTRAKGAR